MKKHSLTVLVLALVLLIAVCLAVPAQAAAKKAREEEECLQRAGEYAREYAVDQIKASFARFYNVTSVNTEIINLEAIDSDSFGVSVSVFLTRVLKAQSARDLPFIQGVEAGIAALSDPDEIAAAQGYLEMRIKDLDGLYIGEEQTESAEVYVVIPRSDVAPEATGDPSPTIFWVDPITGEKLSMDSFSPDSAEEMYDSGISMVQEIAASCHTG